VTHRDLPAVGETRFHAGRRLAIEHQDLVPRLAQEPRRGDADDAGAEDDDSHRATSYFVGFMAIYGLAQQGEL